MYYNGTKKYRRRKREREREGEWEREREREIRNKIENFKECGGVVRSYIIFEQYIMLSNLDTFYIVIFIEISFCNFLLIHQIVFKRVKHLLFFPSVIIFSFSFCLSSFRSFYPLLILLLFIIYVQYTYTSLTFYIFMILCGPLSISILCGPLLIYFLPFFLFIPL